MGKILMVHSFRGGTGKTNTSANVGALLATIGLRVAVIDTDIQSPGIHVLFGLDEKGIDKTLNSYLWGESKIEEAAIDVTDRLSDAAEGKYFLIPSSIKASDIARVLRDGYNVTLLDDGYKNLLDALELDILIIDTHPGLNDEILLSMAFADTLGIILRPDQQDYQGTSISMKLAKNLDVKDIMLIVNKSPQLFQDEMVKAKVEEAYKGEVAAVIPHSDELLALSSAKLFVVEHPDDPITKIFKQITKRFIS
ncbi:MAG: MinD/ParA family protein [Anaerolineales bacterium]|nr:MinD/ParA family protein [Chloroflexota bacterium]MBL6982164.1 MinD/ParA family protein [Anaerolineales bacterium]